MKKKSCKIFVDRLTLNHSKEAKIELLSQVIIKVYFSNAFKLNWEMNVLYDILNVIN